LKTSDLDYDFPESLIAQTPIEPRDAARLLIVDRARDALAHRRFYELGEYLRAGDLLVFNETRVLPARLFASKQPHGGRVEVLLLKKRDDFTWEALVGGSGVRAGVRLRITPREGSPAIELGAQVIDELDRSTRVIRFDRAIEDQLAAVGHTPLPPYIHTPLNDPERYQTVYARLPGSAAAPTAGLHFTQRLLQTLRAQGVEMAFVELRVGLDTFSPIHASEVEQHHIHSEYCRLSVETAEAIARAKDRAARVIAVGTTTVRTLETAARAGRVAAFEGSTELFITPGFEFQVVDALITNFHLPRTTLLALVAAFADRERILKAYRAAVDEGYRLFSFGDAMLIL
jgi:S-adenosylmethionine:tRNA ribosyltransferase-isomerase